MVLGKSPASVVDPTPSFGAKRVIGPRLRRIGLILAPALMAACGGASPIDPPESLEPRLEVTKEALASPVTAATEFGFVVRITNSGTGPATQLVVRDTLPSGADGPWLIAANTACRVTASTGILDCSLPSLAAGADFSVQVTSFASRYSCGLFSSRVHAAAEEVAAITADAEVSVVCPDGQPEGILSGRTPLASRPFGLDVSVLGDVYVARLDADVARGVTPFGDVEGSIPVGFVPRDVTFTPRGTMAVVTNEGSGNIGLVDVATHAQTRTLLVTGSPFRVITNPSGDRAYVSANDHVVSVIDLVTRRVLASISVGRDPNGLTFSTDASLLYASSSRGTTISEIDLATNAVRRTFEIGEASQDIAVSADGGVLYAALEGSGRVAKVDLATGALDGFIGLPTGARPFGLGLTRSGARLYVSGGMATGAIYVIDLPTGQIERELIVGGNPRRIAFTNDGFTALFTNESGWVDVIR
ncbi:MAG: hypothetical protein ABFS34_03340 [Gemmatimonadota bacterium]